MTNVQKSELVISLENIYGKLKNISPSQLSFKKVSKIFLDFEYMYLQGETMPFDNAVIERFLIQMSVFSDKEIANKMKITISAGQESNKRSVDSNHHEIPIKCPHCKLAPTNPGVSC